MSKLFIKDRFATTPNALLYNSNISLRAKGLFAYIQGKPDKWNFSAERIALECKEGLQSVRSALRELETFGYLQRVKSKNEKGHWEWDYILHSAPSNPADENHTTENHTTENHTTENHTTENHTTENYTNINKTDIIKKDNKPNNKKTYSKLERYFFCSDDWFLIWEKWLEYKSEIKSNYKTNLSESTAYKKLLELSNNNLEIADKIIMQSIENDWKGLFELKNNEKKGSTLNF